MKRGGEVEGMPRCRFLISYNETCIVGERFGTRGWIGQEVIVGWGWRWGGENSGGAWVQERRRLSSGESEGPPSLNKIVVKGGHYKHDDDDLLHPQPPPLYPSRYTSG